MLQRRSFAIIAAILAVSLMSGIATAAPTVPGAIYGEFSAEKLPTQIQDVLQKAGVTDVKPADWFAGSIATLLDAGLLKADAGGKVNPQKKASVGETASIFARVLGLATKTDSDSVATASMVKAGLVAGEANVNADMSRLEVARLLAKALKVSPKAIANAADYPFKDFGLVSAEDRGLLKALYDLGIFKGYPDKSFGPNDILTKAQIAILVDRLLGSH